MLEILPNPDIGSFTKEDGEVVATGQAGCLTIRKPDAADLPNLDETSSRPIDRAALARGAALATTGRAILMLYGSLRERSYSRLR